MLAAHQRIKLRKQAEQVELRRAQQLTIGRPDPFQSTVLLGSNRVDPRRRYGTDRGSSSAEHFMPGSQLCCPYGTQGLVNMKSFKMRIQRLGLGRGFSSKRDDYAK